MARRRRWKLLDLYCGAGGAAMGYFRAGFEVTGVDIVAQPNYPFRFVEADALEIDPTGFDAIHASPPCQAFSRMRNATGRRANHVNLIPATRELLKAAGVPYVIENVPSAPLLRPAIICGASLKLEIIRHRAFETNWWLWVPRCAHVDCGTTTGRYATLYPSRTVREGRVVPPRRSEREWAAAIGVDWMTAKELRQAIPPAYTEHIGERLLKHLRKGVI